MNKKVELLYGKGKITVEVPEENILQILEPKEVPGIENVELEIERAIENPIGAKLEEIINPNDKIAIIVPDHTRRGVPIEKISSILLKKLLEIGVNNISFIVASGAHLKPPEKELENMFGKIFKEFKVIIHDPVDYGKLTYVGRTSFGTEIYANSIVYNANKKIAIGGIAPHPFAGYSGGAKSILCGVCGVKTLKQNHSWMINPKAKSGILEGNPVYEDIVEAAKIVGLDFIVNVVVNHKGEVVKVVAGDFIKAHLEGAKIADEIYRTPIKEKADIIIASAGGYPIDSTLQLSLKAIENALAASKDGGIVILATACEDGTGLDTFFPGKDPFQEILVSPVHEFVRAIKIPRLLILITELSDDVVNKLLLRKVPMAQALEGAFDIKGPDAKVIVMPYAWRTEPVVSS